MSIISPQAGEWSVRQATIDDAEALALVGAATFLDSFAGIVDGKGILNHCLTRHSAEAYRTALAHGAQAWIAEVAPGAAPVGYAMLAQPDLAQAEPGDIELKRIYTLGRYHGSGMAGALMRAALEACDGHNRLLLGVYQDNLRALAFYSKNGFTVIGERQFNVGGEVYDDLVLARPLMA